MKVSVVIPTHNRCTLVQKTIDSVLKQTFSDYEIIVVDDGSIDETEQALKKYADRISYIKQEKSGVNRARNRALSIATGEYIALLDDDDIWLPWTLALYVKALDEHPAAAVAFSDFFVLKNDSQKSPHGLWNWFSATPNWNEIYDSVIDVSFAEYSGEKHPHINNIKIYSGDIYLSSLFGPRVLPSASLYRNSMARAAAISLNENDSLCGDWEFFARLSHAYEVVFIDLEAACNRSHEDAVRLTRTDHKIQLTNRLEMIDRVWKQDAEFLAEHSAATSEEECQLSYQLLKMYLFQLDKKTARLVLARMEKLGDLADHDKLFLARLLIRTPGSCYLLIFIRYVLCIIKSGKL